MEISSAQTGEKFSCSREPRDSQSSSLLVGLLPGKIYRYNITSVYDKTEGEGLLGLTLLMGETVASGIAREAAQDESYRKNREENRGVRLRVLENSNRQEWLLIMNLIQPLLLPGSSRTYLFDRINITSFIQQIEDLFDFYKVLQKDQKSTLIQYCIQDTRVKIKQIVEYQNLGILIESLYQVLKLEY